MPNAALMRKVASAFEKADLQPLFDALDERIVWKSAATNKGVFRFGGEYHDAIGVLEVTSQIATEFYFHRFEPKEIVTTGDVVWGIFSVEADYKPRGKPTQRPLPVKFECAIRWRIHDGKIVEHQSFFDTASLLIQQEKARTVSASPT